MSAPNRLGALHAELEGASSAAPGSLVRSFRTRLAEVQAQLTADRGARDGVRAHYEARVRALDSELATKAAALAARERELAAARGEAAVLRGELAAALQQRDADVARLLQAVKQSGAAAASAAAAAAPVALDAAPGGGGSGEQPECIVSSGGASLVGELRRLLDAERRDAHAAKARLAAELATRSDAELVLRALIDEAKAALAAQRAQIAGEQRTAAAAAGAAAVGASAAAHQRRGVGEAAASAAASATAALVPLLAPLTGSEWLQSAEQHQRSELLQALLAQEEVLAALRGAIVRVHACERV